MFQYFDAFEIESRFFWIMSDIVINKKYIVLE